VKKKVLAVLFALVFAVGGTAQGASFNGEKKDNRIDKKINQVKVLEKFQKKSEKSQKELKISWNEKKGIPSFVTGDLSEKPIRSEDDAISFLNDNKALFNLEYGNFEIERVDVDELGTKHYRGKLVVDGIPVYGTDLIVHTDSNGNVYSINGQADDTIPTDKWNKKIKVSAKEAISEAEIFLGLKPSKADIKSGYSTDYKTEYLTEPTAETYLYNYKGDWQVVQMVTLQFMGSNPGNWRIFVNAEKGKVVDSFNRNSTFLLSYGVRLFY